MSAITYASLREIEVVVKQMAMDSSTAVAAQIIDALLQERQQFRDLVRELLGKLESDCDFMAPAAIEHCVEQLTALVFSGAEYEP